MEGVREKKSQTRRGELAYLKLGAKVKARSHFLRKRLKGISTS